MTDPYIDSSGMAFFEELLMRTAFIVESGMLL